MDSSQILIVVEEERKWRDRRTRLEHRLLQVRARKRYLQRELDLVRRRIAELEGGPGKVREVSPESLPFRTVW
jgi:predicted  nucleic acid-binding Zn-ribbon protein